MGTIKLRITHLVDKLTGVSLNVNIVMLKIWTWADAVYKKVGSAS